MNPEPELNRAKAWTYDLLNHQYPAGNRSIPVQTVPAGALLFHYFKIPAINPGELDDAYRHRLLDVILGQNGVSISYITHIDGSKRWRICIDKEPVSYQYYYPNPSAGFGIAGFGNQFNAAIVAITRRESRWAYLKSGTMIPNNEAIHRGLNLARDPSRLQTCDSLNNPPQPGQGQVPGNGSCKAGNNYDVCLTRNFQILQQVDGITSIAGEDSLFDIQFQHGQHQPLLLNKSMYIAVNNWYRSIQANFNDPAIDPNIKTINKGLWSMNLACLETDLRNPSLFVGFREFATPPFGRTNNELPPQNLPVPEYGYVNHAYFVQTTQRNGIDVKRVFEFTNDLQMVNFYRDYVMPLLLMEPLAIVTPTEVIQLQDLVPGIQQLQIPQILYDPNPENLRYMLNLRMGQYLSTIPNGVWFDTRLNMFFVRHRPELLADQTGPSNLSFQITEAFRNPLNRYLHFLNQGLQAGNPLLNPPYIGTGYQKSHYMVPFQFGNDDIEIHKLLHELITTVKWHTNWMDEFFFSDPVSGQTLPLQVGPFYSSFSHHGPINVNTILNVYQNIIQSLEANVLGHLNSSITLSILQGRLQTHIYKLRSDNNIILNQRLRVVNSSAQSIIICTPYVQNASRMYLASIQGHLIYSDPVHQHIPGIPIPNYTYYIFEHLRDERYHFYDVNGQLFVYNDVNNMYVERIQIRLLDHIQDWLDKPNNVSYTTAHNSVLPYSAGSWFPTVPRTAFRPPGRPYPLAQQAGGSYSKRKRMNTRKQCGYRKRKTRKIHSGGGRTRNTLNTANMIRSSQQANKETDLNSEIVDGGHTSVNIVDMDKKTHEEVKNLLTEFGKLFDFSSIPPKTTSQ
jgi:hypothetical protein